MITLYQFPGESGWSLSPYCNKVQIALRLKGLQYQTVAVRFPRGISATGRLPVLDLDGERLHDSTEIVRRLDQRFAEPALLPRDRALAAHAFIVEEWADESLTRVMQYARTVAPGFQRRFAQLVLPKVPGALARSLLVPRFRHLMKVVGHLGEGGPAAFQRLAERHLDAVDAMVAERQWLLGDTPSAADASVGAALLCLDIVPCEARGWLAARPHASAWFGRLRERVGLPPVA